MSLGQHIGYFIGKKGHEMELVFLRRTVPVRSRSDALRMDRADFVGLIHQGPRTDGWSGMIPSGRGTLYVPAVKDKQGAVNALRERYNSVLVEKDRYDSDPAYALEKELKGHDWFYHYSDDHSVFSAGERHWDLIRDLLRKVDSAIAKKLWSQYAPEGFRLPD